MIAPGIAGRVLACDFAAALTVRSGSPPWMRLHAQAARRQIVPAECADTADFGG